MRTCCHAAPRALHRIEADLRQRAARIVDAALSKGSCDFLVDVAAELPLQAVAQLVGVPQEDRHELMNWANVSAVRSCRHRRNRPRPASLKSRQSSKLRRASCASARSKTFKQR
jgi:cytochrome P450